MPPMRGALSGSLIVAVSVYPFAGYTGMRWPIVLVSSGLADPAASTTASV